MKNLMPPYNHFEAQLAKDKAIIEKEWVDRLNGCKDTCSLSIETARKQGAKEEKERIIGILKKAYPSISTWPCWETIESEPNPGV